MTSSGTHSSRFTGRVESYKRFRPGYPQEILDLLRHECGLTPESNIVDVAAGTGLFSEIFLHNGNPVIAIEPNDEMRTVCETRQPDYPRLVVRSGTAEVTGLPSKIADFLTVAQAMHWFDLRRARQEFARVLRTDGWCVIAYNERRLGGDTFHEGMEELLVNFGIDYQHVRRRHLGDAQLREFFEPHVIRCQTLPNSQLLDLDALVGRIVSSSYMPTQTHPRYGEMLRSIEQLFDENQRDGTIRLEYDCVIRFGQLN